MTLLVEDLLLLLIDDTTGKAVLDRTRLERVLAGALLVELAMAERVTPAPSLGSPRVGRLVVRDRSALGDGLLDEALARLSGKPLRPARAVEKLVKGLRRAVLTRLVDAGLVRAERRTVLGVFPTTAWPAVRPEHAAQVRSTLRSVLVGGHRPDARTAALICLLTAVDAVPKVLPGQDKRALVRRARQIADGDWAGRAVRQAVDAINVAVVAVTTAS